jgi:hypothetical protein
MVRATWTHLGGFEGIGAALCSCADVLAGVFAVVIGATAGDKLDSEIQKWVPGQKSTT